MSRKSQYLQSVATSISLCAAAFALLHSSIAAAEDETAASGSGLDEIIVTAEKRDIGLQTAPLSVSVMTAETLRAANITDITGLNGTVPSLLVARSGGGELMLVIRGIGSETPENTNTQPGVSYHIDGAYIFNSIAAKAAFVDVAQVEVLRGPQGTLFGQGSTGGTINVVSIEPSTEAVTGRLNAGLGNYKYREASAAINVPLGDTFAIRGAIDYTKHDGYAHATKVPGYDLYPLDDADEVGARIGAKWQPTEKFSIVLNTIQFRSDTNGPAQKNILDPDPDPRRLTQDYTGRAYVRTQLYTGVMKYEADFATFKSITSYQKLHSEQQWDGDGLDEDLFFALTYNPISWTGNGYDHVALWQSDTESWTQELNISSNSSGPFTWVAGGVYLHSKNSQYINEFRSNDGQILRPALPSDTPAVSPLITPITYAELSSVTRKSWAIFAQGTYAFTDQLSLTAGLRYNHDKATGYSDSMSGGSSNWTSGPFLQPEAREPFSGDAVTGKVALDYQITPANMVYASYTRGFKPGGINTSSGAYQSFGWEDAIKPTYKNETVDSFEIGSKNRFADNTAQLNVSAFLYNYKNMQFLEEDPVLFGEGIANAPSARVYGLEAEGSWMVTPEFRLDASLSWLEGEFTGDYYALDPAAAQAAQNAAGFPDWLFWSNYYAASVARDGARQNIKGNRIPKLPRWQGNIAATYTGEVGPGTLTARAQLIYRGEYQYRLFNDSDVDTTPDYAQVNLMLKYQPEDTGFDITARITNLFDTAGVNSRFSDPYGSAQVMETYIPPRQFILSVGYRF